MDFSNLSAHGGHVLPGAQRGHARFEPTLDQVTVAVEKLNEERLGRYFRNFAGALVASPSSAERLRRVKFHNNKARLCCVLSASVHGAGIDVDDSRSYSLHRRKAAP